jgi:hypothetical protein
MMARAVLLLALALESRAAAETTRFAVVIGNNRPETPREVTLRYADDDAVATHRLLAEAGVHSVLIATLDAETARWTEGLRPAGPATFTALSRVLDDLYAKMRASGDAELYLFYSGHGDVAHGEGYVMLEDRRLTRSLLYQLLARSPAARNHVIIDACKSYFLAFERGPGGERSAYAHAFDEAQLPAALANTGFILSTSSDRDSHEWERFQGGIFSHEVRSALRGAADLDGDGRISYAELGAFLATANQGIENARFRPDFAIRPPARRLDTALLTWAGSLTATAGSELGHFYVENATGERLLDGHAAPEQTLALRLPTERPLFVRKSDESLEYVLSDEGPARLADMVPTPPTARRRGALHVAFERLFAVPFGRASLADFARGRAQEERWLEHARLVERSRARTRTTLGIGTLALLTAGVVLGAITIERYVKGQSASQAERVRINQTLGGLEPALGVTLGAAGVTGAAWLTTTLRWR